MEPSRRETKADEQSVKIPVEGAKSYALSDAIGNSAGSGVSDDAVAKVDALEKRLDELQAILDSLAEHH
jgi:uncharacterized protein YceH (UPF0502 family)